MSASVPSPSLLHRLIGASARALAALGFAALCLGGAAMLHWRAAAVATPEPTPPIPVQAEALLMADSFTVDERYTGRLAAARSAQLAFERPGLVLNVAVDEGARVEAGDVIASLDTRSLLSARRALVAQRRQVEADHQLSVRTADRQQRLVDDGHASQQRFDEARFRTQALAAQLDALQAEIDAIDIDLDKSQIRAPFAGAVTARLIDEGAVVAAGTPLVELIEIAQLEARIGLPSAVANTLQIGDAVDLWINDTQVPAELHASRDDLRAETRTVTAVFRLKQRTSAPVGELVRFVHQRIVAKAGAYVPLSALREGRQGLWTILTVHADSGDTSVVGSEAAQIVHSDGTRAFVRGTFRAGTLFITDGTNRVAPGQTVRVATR